MSRIGTIVVAVAGGILVLWILISRSAGMEQVRDFKRVVNLRYPGRIHRKVPVQRFSESDYRSYFVDDGKWEVREFADCRFAAPPGDFGSQPSEEMEYIRGGDQFDLIVRRNMPFVNNFEGAVSFREEVRKHVDDRFFLWKPFFMGKDAYKDYTTSISQACSTIGEVDKIEIVNMDDGTVLVVAYDNLAAPHEDGEIIDSPESWKGRYVGYIYASNKTLGVQDIIDYSGEDPQERDQAIHRIVATYACGSTSGTASTSPGG
jgi:hypothetical protein